MRITWSAWKQQQFEKVARPLEVDNLRPLVGVGRAAYEKRPAPPS